MDERERRDFNAGLSEELDAWLRGDTSRREFLTKLMLMGGAAMLPGLGYTASGSKAWAAMADVSKVELADKSTPLGQTQAAAVKASTEGPTDGSAYRAVQEAQKFKDKVPRREDPVLPDLLRRPVADRADRRCLTSWSLSSSASRTSRIRSTSNSWKRRSVVRRPPPWDSAAKSTWRSSCVTPAGSSAGISGWTWGDCCELQSLWVEPGLRGRGLATRLIAAAEAEAAARGCSQTVHFTYALQHSFPPRWRGAI